MLTIDHVIFTVGDLNEAAERIYRDHGLASVAGGRHPGHGTGNRIIPLGPNYVELMTAVDPEEAATSALGRWVLERSAEGDRLSALCLRTDDMNAVCSRLDVAPLAMSRRRPDGELLEWHLAGLDQMLKEALPFFIQWHADPEDLPGRMQAQHAVEVKGIQWVEIGGDRRSIDNWLGKHRPGVRTAGGAAGIRRLSIATGGGEIVL